VQPTQQRGPVTVDWQSKVAVVAKSDDDLHVTSRLGRTDGTPVCRLEVDRTTRAVVGAPAAGERLTPDQRICTSLIRTAVLPRLVSRMSMWSVPSSMRCWTRLARIRTWRSEGEADEVREPFVGSSLVVHPVHSNSTVTPTAMAGPTRSRERLAEERERGEPRGGILTDPIR